MHRGTGVGFPGGTSLRFALLCLVVLLLGPGGRTAYLCPGRLLPDAIRWPIRKRPAGLFTRLDGDEPQKLAVAPLSVFLLATC